MRKLFIAVFMFVSTFTTNIYADGHAIKMGIILGFTGPIESLTPAMAASAELAFKEASDSGSLLGGKKIEPLRADSTCVDSAAATTAAEGLISQGVAAIMGADCSGVTGAIASNVAVPKGVVMISPSATSPGLTTLDDKGFFFRTAPSDARGGQILADITKDRGIKSVAITYTNNDYGKGLADVYAAAVKAHGIKVTTSAAHEDGKADYSSEVGVLASACKTTAPEIIWTDGKAHLYSEMSASIGYKIASSENWSLYQKPIDKQNFQYKAVRYGYYESDTLFAEKPSPTE